jgi:ABC-type phosphate transport system substrate-binding protein
VLPAIKIAPLHRKSGSGDTFLFTSYLSTQDYALAKTIAAAPAWYAVNDKGS